MRTVISLENAQENLDEVLDAARAEPIVIDRPGRPGVVLVDYDHYLELMVRVRKPKRQFGALKHLSITPDDILNVSIEDEFD